MLQEHFVPCVSFLGEGVCGEVRKTNEWQRQVKERAKCRDDMSAARRLPLVSVHDLRDLRDLRAGRAPAPRERAVQGLESGYFWSSHTFSVKSTIWRALGGIEHVSDSDRANKRDKAHPRTLRAILSEVKTS